MNLEESNEFIAFERKKSKKKKIILFLIISLIVTAVLLVVFLIFLANKQSQEAKLYFNGKKVQLPVGMFFVKDEITYVSAKDMEVFVNGQYNKGEYKTFTQDPNFGYVQTKYEVVSFNVGSRYIKKYIINNEEKDPRISVPKNEEENPITVESENNSMEVLEISSEVILENDKIYIPVEDINRIFNVRCSINDTEITIYNLDYLFTYAQKIIGNYNVTEISGTYENLRALAQNMVVVKNKNDKCGVISLDTGESVLSFQYSKILYLQSTNEFFVYTDNSVGLLDINGKTIIAPKKYESLSIFDEINKLYLAGKGGKYGIVNNKGDEIISTSFKSIGTNSIVDLDEYEMPETETPNLLDSKYIIVTDESYVGLFDKKGKRILRAVYDDFGYIASQSDKKKEIRSTLLIPKSVGVNGVIIKQGGYYGICDLDKAEIIIPCSLSKIYCKTKNGETTYYMEIGDETIDIKQYLKENDLYSDEEDEDESEYDEEDKENEDKENKDRENEDRENEDYDEYNENENKNDKKQEENNVDQNQTSDNWDYEDDYDEDKNNNNRNKNDNQNQVNNNQDDDNYYYEESNNNRSDDNDNVRSYMEENEIVDEEN